jgi:hypothetical protein
MPPGKIVIPLRRRGSPGTQFEVSRPPLMRSSWRPVLKTLQVPLGCENGPSVVSGMPGGKNGWAMNPTAREVKATLPSRGTPSRR